jgi:hypothetical protein
MAKAQGKKAVAAGKKAAKKVVARVKSAAGAAKKKVAQKKSATPPKPAARKVAAKPAKPAPKKVAAKPAKPVKKAAAKVVKKAAKAVKTVAKAVAKTVGKKVVAKVKKVAPALKPKASPKAAAAKTPAKTPAAKTTALKLVPKALPPAELKAAAPVAAPAPARAAEPEKKRGRRARPRVTSSGAPAAAWLTDVKPRPASFIPAPARAEAPSAVAAPPASSDRLIRPDDVDHPAVRTVPVRIDVEQGAGRYYVIANPLEVSVRPGEGIEWDFRYLGGADVSVEEVVIEFEKPSPFTQTVFRTRKPGGARPHRQMSDGALPAAAGRRIQYTVRAINPFKTELANTKIWVTITA